MNETHQCVTHIGAAKGLKEQAVFAMEDGHLQSAFGDIVAKWRVFHFEKERKRLSVISHIRNGFTQSGIGFHLLLLELFFEPFFQFVHSGAALALMKQ